MSSCYFPFRKTFNQEILLNLVEKTKQTIVRPTSLVNYVFIITSFDLCMEPKGHMTFLL
jgi:hypothetical protein